MAGHEYSQVRPQATQDRTRVAAGSPLALQGIFIEVLRSKFAKGNGSQWTWDLDPTLSDITIESSFNAETEVNNNAPALYVRRMRSVPVKQMVGDRVGVHLASHTEGFGAIMTTPMAIECVSPDEGESSILGDIVHGTLLTGQDVIQRYFGLHSFEHPMLRPPSPFEQDNTKWVSPVTFTIEFWIRWGSTPIGPLIQQIAQRTTLGTTAYFTDIAINSITRFQNGRP